MRVGDLPTPALVVDAGVLAANLDVMRDALPGGRLRPYVKAHKCTEVAREQVARGHAGLTVATPREALGLAAVGLGGDLLLANQVLDPVRLRALAECGARVTVAVDSDATVAAAAAAGIREVLVDVAVGMPRCGCDPAEAGRIAERARAAGLTVRGIMGYEGHVVGRPDRAERAAGVAAATEILLAAHADVGGDVISSGGTTTYDLHTAATEIQAGSYALMDTAYDAFGLPFTVAVGIIATVLHVGSRHAVADCGLKALGMDHGDPTVEDGDVWFCSDEHLTFAARGPLAVGDRVVVRPAHVDPTIALHEHLHVAEAVHREAAVIDTWPIDLRGWDPPGTRR
ncbi:MAG: alanine racemase [Actinomycetota bacterium]